MIPKKLITTTITPPIDDGLPKMVPLRLTELRFPFGEMAGWVILFAIGGTFVYRLSETGGPASEKACVAAVVVASIAAIAGVVPVILAWRRELLWVVLSVFLSGAIRLLIGLVGMVIITFSTAIERTKFVGFLALFYTAFMAADIWLSLWVLRHTTIRTEKQETAAHGNT